jgi:hypothetical protein
MEQLIEEFNLCAVRYPPLFHERIAAWSTDIDDGTEVPLSLDEWQMVIESDDSLDRSESFEMGTWDGPWSICNENDLMGRYSGSLEGLEHFKELAQLAYDSLIDLGFHRKECAKGYHVWLYLLHDVAFRHQPFLLTAELRAGFPREDRTIDEIDDMLGTWREINGEWLPKFPLIFRLKHDLFTCSKSLLRLLLEPEQLVSGGEALSSLLDPDLFTQRSTSTSIQTQNASNESKVPHNDKTVITDCIQSTDITRSTIRKTGKLTEITFCDGENIDRCPPILCIGASHFAQLIEAEGRPVLVSALAMRSTSPGARHYPSFSKSQAIKHLGMEDVGQMHVDGAKLDSIDSEAIRSLNGKLAEIDQEMLVAMQTGNDREEKRLEEEHRKISEFLKKNVNLAGLARRTGKQTPMEAARKRVFAAKDYLVETLRSHGCHGLADHILCSVKSFSGEFYVYQPSTDRFWATDKGVFRIRGFEKRVVDDND